MVDESTSSPLSWQAWWICEYRMYMCTTTSTHNTNMKYTDMSVCFEPVWPKRQQTLCLKQTQPKLLNEQFLLCHAYVNSLTLFQDDATWFCPPLPLDTMVGFPTHNLSAQTSITYWNALRNNTFNVTNTQPIYMAFTYISAFKFFFDSQCLQSMDVFKPPFTSI